MDTHLPQTSRAMRNAIAAILVDGTSWRKAAISHNVTESGIHRAMRRGGIKEFAMAMGKSS
ncbi:MAG: helix-turn-helix domain-containing protein [Burkholderiaceae bacterium]